MGVCLCMCVLSSVSAVPPPPNRVCPCVHTMKVELLKACLKRDAPSLWPVFGPLY